MVAYPTACLLAAIVLRGAAAEEPGAAPPPAGVLARKEAPAEYRGPALPLESSELESAFRRAEEHLQAQEWARGLAALDDVLAQVTLPAGKARPKSAAPRPKAEAPAPVRGLGRRAAAPAAAQPAEEIDVDPRESLLSPDAILYLPAARVIRERLLELPKEARELYRRTYEAPARKAMEQATSLPRDKAMVELRRLGERYPLTPQGAAAWRLLAHQLQGSGKHFEAARAFDVAASLSGDADSSARAQLLANAGAAYLRASCGQSGVRRLDTLAGDFADAVIPVRGEAFSGRDLRGETYFKAELERLSAPPAGPFTWTSSRGTFDHASLSAAVDLSAQVGSVAEWVFRLLPEQPPDSNRRVLPGSGAPRGAALGDLIYFRRGSDLVALRASTGKIAWQVDPTELLAHSAGSQSSRHYQYGGEAAVENAATAVTVLSSAVTGGRALVLVVPAAVHGSNDEAGQPTFEPNIIAAYDAGSGKLVWVFGRTRSEWDPVQGLAFTAPPTLSGGVLVAPAVRGQSIFAVGFSTAGKVRWVRRLYSFPTGQETPYGGLAIPGVPMAAQDGIAVLALGQGLACAVETESGAIAWVTRYRSRTRSANNQYHAWSAQHTAPVVTRDRALLRPSDSDVLTAVDLHTGKVVWDRAFEPDEVPRVLGADNDRAFIGAARLRALRLSDGQELWTSPRVAGTRELHEQAESGGEEAEQDGGEMVYAFGMPASANAQVATAVFTRSSILTGTGDGYLAVFDSATGKVERRVRVTDPRLGGREPFNLFLADGAVLALGAGKLYRLEPQTASWQAAGDEAGRFLGHRARLLRAEGRYEEALQAYEAFRGALKATHLIEAAEREIVATTRQAALAAGKPELLARLLARTPPLVKDRTESLSLRLLEAALLEKRGDLAAAVAAYLPLAALDGLVARAGDSLEVDVGSYAADSLRELRSRGAAVDDAAGEEHARSVLERDRRQGQRPLSFLLMRRAHLAAAGAARREMLAAAEAAGDEEAALALLELGATDGAPDVLDEATVRRRDELRARRRREQVTPGLDAVVAPLKAAPQARLTQAFWLSQEEGFLAASGQGSQPMPALVAIAGTELRLHGPGGEVLVKRALPEYPDVSAVKLAMESSVEEPAHAYLGDGTLVVATAAGLYAFRGLVPPEKGAPLRARDLRLSWAHPCPHPLADSSMRSRGGWWGGLRLPQNTVYFPEVTFEGGSPVVLLRDGALYCVDPRSGKLRFRTSLEHGSPAARPFASGKHWLVRTGTPAGIEIVEPGKRKQRGAGGRRWIEGPSAGANEAAIAAGGLAAAFQTNTGVEVVESASGRLLWRRTGTLAFTTAAEVWMVESPDRLVARAVRSGRELRSVRLAAGSVVLSAFEELTSAGEVEAWTLVLSQNAVRGRYSYYYYGRNQTGTHLSLVQVTPAGEKRWEKRLIEGGVTYGGDRWLLSGGSFVLLLNRQTEDEKWYTQAVLVEPSGTSRELLSVELHGKGTGLEPRLQVLDGGLAVGNTDGFGWFSAPRPPPGGVDPEPKDNKETK